MSDYWRERFWLMVLVTITVVVIVSIVYGIDNTREWLREVKRVEISTGCGYVGGPKGTNRVGFFDCNGVIETKRIK